MSIIKSKFFVMRKPLVIIFLLSFFSCNNDQSPHNEKFFDPQKLNLLSLEEVNNFWQDDSVKQISNFIDGIFNSHPGFLSGVGYRGTKKGNIVSVFKSQADAIEAMEVRRLNVAAVIEPGISNEFLKGRWWFSENIPNIVFLNQWNTIVEVYCYNSSFEEVKTLLFETAAEIARRIDSLSR